MNANEAIVRISRSQAWARAKGELEAILVTYCSSIIEEDAKHFEKMDKAVKEFVKHVEDNGLVE